MDIIDNTRFPLWKRIAWMIMIWTASVCVLGTITMIIRYWLI
ncbi:DUF2474 domain-containing protein [Paraburkholderia sp. SIMBA_054]